ncbi:MAG: hypothetical protein EOO52_05815 [Gammaproteobacteria bacterium]|nr:MAG: hypothetical protein EOO52_05815 [Gammaproteobacteria bacterium]
MFYWPKRIRTQTGFLRPKGPDFSSAEKKIVDLSGTQIIFRVPQNNTQSSSCTVDPHNEYDLSQLQTDIVGIGGDKWRSQELIRRSWDFYGPWFTGHLGSVDMYAGIFVPKQPTSELNFFNPRVLEAGITNYLTLKFGNDFSLSGDQQSWLVPQNWRQQPNMPCLAARFDAVVNKNVYDDGMVSFLIFPLSRKHLLITYCVMSRINVFTNKIPKPTIDEWIDQMPFIELSNRVLDGLEVTLSSQAQSEQEEGLRDLENKFLVKQFPPLKWMSPTK